MFIPYYGFAGFWCKGFGKAALNMRVKIPANKPVSAALRMDGLIFVFTGCHICDSQYTFFPLADSI